MADANVLKVLLAGSDAPAARCLRRLLEVCCVLLMCPKLWTESHTATGRQGVPVSKEAFHVLLAQRGRGKLVHHPPTEECIFKLPRKTPPEDEYLVHFALERQARWLISNDRKLVAAIEGWIRGHGTWCGMADDMLALLDGCG